MLHARAAAAAASRHQFYTAMYMHSKCMSTAMPPKSKGGKVQALSDACTAKAVGTTSASDFTPRLLSQLCFVAWTQVAAPPASRSHSP